MNLLENLVDVGGVGFLSGTLLLLLVTFSGGSLLDSLLSRCFSSRSLGGGSLSSGGSGFLLYNCVKVCQSK